MNSPKVSIIIPNYNYAKYIAETIDSVLAQTYPNFEVIVVDDGSKDDSLKILEKYAGQIKVIKQQNQGVSRARNNGAANSAGEYLAFLDADDVWLPAKLERQMQRFFEDSEVGLVHCSMKFIDIEGKITGESRKGKEGWVAEELLKLKEGVVIGAGSTAVVKRALFDKIKGFDHRLTTAADWEFCYRIARDNKIAFVSEPLVLYRIHNSNMHSNVGAMEHDVLIGFQKAFDDDSAEKQVDRSECYGNFHLMLAGSYFHAKNYSAFLKNALKSVWYKPQTAINYLAFPVRKLKKR